MPFNFEKFEFMNNFDTSLILIKVNFFSKDVCLLNTVYSLTFY